MKILNSKVQRSMFILNNLSKKYFYEIENIKKGNYKNNKLLSELQEQLNNPDDFQEEYKEAYFKIFEIYFKNTKRQEEESNMIFSYLRLLPNFFVKLNLAVNEEQSFMNYLSKKLEYFYLKKQSFLFRVGDISDKIYIILKGEVELIIPKSYKIFMNEPEYFRYLVRLYRNNEFYLLNNTLKNNKSIYQMYFDKFYEIIQNYFTLLASCSDKINEKGRILVEDKTDEPKRTRLNYNEIVKNLSNGSKLIDDFEINDNKLEETILIEFLNEQKIKYNSNTSGDSNIEFIARLYKNNRNAYLNVSQTIKNYVKEHLNTEWENENFQNLSQQDSTTFLLM